MGVKQNWAAAIKDPHYRKRLIVGMVLLVVVLTSFPFFFKYVQARPGKVLDDVLLNCMPAVNLSIALFIVIWLNALLIVVRATASPAIFLNFLWGFIILSACRMTTITLVELDPPARLIPLADPLANAFYGKSFITKDLFFSGHTATVLLICLCLRKKTDRVLSLAATIIVGVLVLFQHVHYTIDVVFAIPFAWLSYYAGSKIAGQPPH